MDRVLLGKNDAGNSGLWVSKPGINVIAYSSNGYLAGTDPGPEGRREDDTVFPIYGHNENFIWTGDETYVYGYVDGYEAPYTIRTHTTSNGTLRHTSNAATSHILKVMNTHPSWAGGSFLGVNIGIDESFNGNTYPLLEIRIRRPKKSDGSDWEVGTGLANNDSKSGDWDYLLSEPVGAITPSYNDFQLLWRSSNSTMTSAPNGWDGYPFAGPGNEDGHAILAFPFSEDDSWVNLVGTEGEWATIEYDFENSIATTVNSLGLMTEYNVRGRNIRNWASNTMIDAIRFSPNLYWHINPLAGELVPKGGGEAGLIPLTPGDEEPDYEIDYIRAKKRGIPINFGNTLDDNFYFSTDWFRTGMVHQTGTVAIGTEYAWANGSSKASGTSHQGSTSGRIEFPKLPYVPVVLFQRYDTLNQDAKLSFPGGDKEFSVAHCDVTSNVQAWNPLTKSYQPTTNTSYASEFRTFAYVRSGYDHFDLTCRNAIARDGYEWLFNYTPQEPYVELYKGGNYNPESENPESFVMYPQTMQMNVSLTDSEAFAAGSGNYPGRIIKTPNLGLVTEKHGQTWASHPGADQFFSGVDPDHPSYGMDNLLEVATFEGEEYDPTVSPSVPLPTNRETGVLFDGDWLRYDVDDTTPRTLSAFDGGLFRARETVEAYSDSPSETRPGIYDFAGGVERHVGRGRRPDVGYFADMPRPANNYYAPIGPLQAFTKYETPRSFFHHKSIFDPDILPSLNNVQLNRPYETRHLRSTEFANPPTFNMPEWRTHGMSNGTIRTIPLATHPQQSANGRWFCDDSSSGAAFAVGRMKEGTLGVRRGNIITVDNIPTEGWDQREGKASNNAFINTASYRSGGEIGAGEFKDLDAALDWSARDYMDGKLGYFANFTGTDKGNCLPTFDWANKFGDWNVPQFNNFYQYDGTDVTSYRSFKDAIGTSWTAANTRFLDDSMWLGYANNRHEYKGDIWHPQAPTKTYDELSGMFGYGGTIKNQGDWAHFAGFGSNDLEEYGYNSRGPSNWADWPQDGYLGIQAVSRYDSPPDDYIVDWVVNSTAVDSGIAVENQYGDSGPFHRDLLFRNRYVYRPFSGVSYENLGDTILERTPDYKGRWNQSSSVFPEDAGTGGWRDHKYRASSDWYSKHTGSPLGSLHRGISQDYAHIDAGASGPGTHATYGAPHDYGRMNAFVPSFSISRTLPSGQYLEYGDPDGFGGFQSGADALSDIRQTIPPNIFWPDRRSIFGNYGDQRDFTHDYVEYRYTTPWNNFLGYDPAEETDAGSPNDQTRNERNQYSTHLGKINVNRNWLESEDIDGRPTSTSEWPQDHFRHHGAMGWAGNRNRSGGEVTSWRVHPYSNDIDPEPIGDRISYAIGAEPGKLVPGTWTDDDLFRGQTGDMEIAREIHDFTTPSGGPPMTPKEPGYTEFSIAEPKKRREFDQPSWTEPQTGYFGHKDSFVVSRWYTYPGATFAYDISNFSGPAHYDAWHKEDEVQDYKRRDYPQLYEGGWGNYGYFPTQEQLDQGKGATRIFGPKTGDIEYSSSDPLVGYYVVYEQGAVEDGWGSPSWPDIYYDGGLTVPTKGGQLVRIGTTDFGSLGGDHTGGGLGSGSSTGLPINSQPDRHYKASTEYGFGIFSPALSTFGYGSIRNVGGITDGNETFLTGGDVIFKKTAVLRRDLPEVAQPGEADSIDGANAVVYFMPNKNHLDKQVSRTFGIPNEVAGDYYASSLVHNERGVVPKNGGGFGSYWANDAFLQEQIQITGHPDVRGMHTKHATFIAGLDSHANVYTYGGFLPPEVSGRVTGISGFDGGQELENWDDTVDVNGDNVDTKRYPDERLNAYLKTRGIDVTKLAVGEAIPITADPYFAGMAFEGTNAMTGAFRAHRFEFKIKKTKWHINHFRQSYEYNLPGKSPHRADTLRPIGYGLVTNFYGFDYTGCPPPAAHSYFDGRQLGGGFENMKSKYDREYPMEINAGQITLDTHPAYSNTYFGGSVLESCYDRESWGHDGLGGGGAGRAAAHRTGSSSDLTGTSTSISRHGRDVITEGIIGAVEVANTYFADQKATYWDSGSSTYKLWLTGDDAKPNTYYHALGKTLKYRPAKSQGATPETQMYGAYLGTPWNRWTDIVPFFAGLNTIYTSTANHWEMDVLPGMCKADNALTNWGTVDLSKFDETANGYRWHNDEWFETDPVGLARSITWAPSKSNTMFSEGLPTIKGYGKDYFGFREGTGEGNERADNYRLTQNQKGGSYDGFKLHERPEFQPVSGDGRYFGGVGGVDNWGGTSYNTWGPGMCVTPTITDLKWTSIQHPFGIVPSETSDANTFYGATSIENQTSYIGGAPNVRVLLNDSGSDYDSANTWSATPNTYLWAIGGNQIECNYWDRTLKVPVLEGTANNGSPDAGWHANTTYHFQYMYDETKIHPPMYKYWVLRIPAGLDAHNGESLL